MGPFPLLTCLRLGPESCPMPRCPHVEPKGDHLTGVPNTGKGSSPPSVELFEQGPGWHLD